MICCRRVFRLNLGIKKYKKKPRFIIQIFAIFFFYSDSYLPTPSSMWLGSQCDYRGPRCPSPVSVCSNPGTIPLCSWDKFPFTETHPEWLILLIYACHLPWIYHMHLIVKNWLSYQRNWILRLMNYCFTVVICTNITSVSLLTRVQSFELSVV